MECASALHKKQTADVDALQQQASDTNAGFWAYMKWLVVLYALM